MYLDVKLTILVMTLLEAIVADLWRSEFKC